MVDIESSVSNKLFTAFKAAYPDGSYSGEPITAAPSKWPHLNIVEADNYSDSYRLPNSSWAVYDINVYSNLTKGAKQQCKEIMKLVDETMMSFGSWERVFCNQTKNADQRIYRMTARYRGIEVEESTDGDTITYRIYRR